jgi:hypothetical protein
MNTSERTHEPTAPAAAHTPLPARDRRLLFGLGLPPLAWSLHLLVGYGLVYPSERLGSKFWLYFVTGVCFTLALLGSVLAAASGRAKPSETNLGAPGSPPERARAIALPPDHDDTRAERARFLALGGSVLGLFFAAVIAAQTVHLVLVALGTK